MLSRDVDKARDAYKENDVELSKEAHDNGEPHGGGAGKYVKSMVYGGLDGIITTFAIVAGVAGASLSSAVVLIMGFANLIADGLSMAIGDYLSTKAENKYNQTERAREVWEVENYPEGERKEMIELYMEKGMSLEDATTMTDVLVKNKKAWVEVMMVEELGIIEEDESPVKNAVVTFISFVTFGFVPMIAYVAATFVPFLRDNTFIIASVLTGLTLFILGALKVRVTGENWLKSGLEMLLVGGIASLAAFGIGYFLSGLA